MHPLATDRFLAAHLSRIAKRADELGWRIEQHGTVLTIQMVHRPTGEIYRLTVMAEEYPLLPVAVDFLPVPEAPNMAKWPDDGNFVLRTASPRPFVCLSGIRSFTPDAAETAIGVGMEEIHVGAVLTNLDKAIHDARYRGPVYLPM